MKRIVYDELLKWKNDKVNNKPLMVLGARQVGKTYIINEFCMKEFEHYCKINLLNDIDIVNLYERTDINSLQKYNYLKTLINFDLDIPNSVLFIDEIQESEQSGGSWLWLCSVKS